MASFSYTPPGGTLYPAPDEFKKINKRSDDNNPSFDDRALNSLGINAIGQNLLLRAYCNVRETALTAFDHSIVCADTTLVPDANNARTRLLPIYNEVISNVLQTPIFGCCAYRVTRTYSSNVNTLELAEVYEPTCLSYRKKLRVVEVLADDSKRNVLYTLKPGINVISDTEFIVCDANFGIAGGGIIKGLMRAEIDRHAALNDWADIVTLLKGIVQVQDKGSDTATRAAVEQTLSSARSHKWMITDEFIEVLSKSIVDGQAGNIINAFVTYWDSAIAIAILGNANTTKLTTTGSYSALQILQMLSADITFSDMNRTQKVCNYITLLDYQLQKDFTIKSAPWSFQFNDFQTNDAEAMAVVVREALATGQKFLASEVYGKLGFTMPDGVDSIIQNTPLI